MKPKPTGLTLYNESLMEVFDFSPGALEMNRQGMLTKAQKDLLRGELKEEADGLWLLMMIMLGVAALLAVIMTMNGISLVPLVIGAGIMLLPLMYIAYRRQTRLNQDIDTPKVASVTGALNVVSGGRIETQTAFAVQVGDQVFPLTREQYEVLAKYEQSYCRVYYSKRSGKLLSAEIDYAEKRKNQDKLKNEQLDSDVVTDENTEALEGDIIYDDQDRSRQQNQQ